jgi:DNA-binding response OmpR family regulator
MQRAKNNSILIVDDEASVRTVLSQVLAEDGFRVTEAADGEAARALFETRPFHLVISDIVMPKLNGIELLRWIKAGYPDTQVIIITSYASLNTAVEALRNGAYDYLFKPFEDLSLISAAVKRATDMIRLTAENRKLIKTLKQHNEDLERRVKKRTAVLEQMNAQLVEEIQERVRAQDAADAAYRARSDFLNRMSHELKSPLNHIVGFADILLGRHYGELNTVQEEYLRDIMENSRELLSMINRLLDVSRIKAERPASLRSKAAATRNDGREAV